MRIFFAEFKWLKIFPKRAKKCAKRKSIQHSNTCDRGTTFIKNQVDESYVSGAFNPATTVIRRTASGGSICGVNFS